jgi:hypothetical protein
MDEVLTMRATDDLFNVIRIISSPGPKLKQPAKKIKKVDAFQHRYIQCGNVIYNANLCTFNAPTETGMATIDLAEHTNGSVYKITYNGTNFAAPSLSPLGGMNTTAVFDLHKGQKACQKRLAERGCEDVLVKDEITDVAVDGDTLLVTTKLMSESAPSERKNGVTNLNDTFVSDVVHTKRIQNVAPGIVDYKVRLNIPANYTWGVVEILSSTFFNDIIIQLMKQRDGWQVMKNATYPNGGFVIAKDPETAMGVMLTEWPKGAVLFPPKVHYNEFEEVNRWSITQQIGSPLNDSVKLPGGEYSWTVKLLFGPIWFCQGKINKAKVQPHGSDHKVMYGEDVAKRNIQQQYTKTKPAHGYPYM